MMEKGRAMEQETLIARISRELEAADLHVAVEVEGDTITLSGQVESNEARQAVEDIVLAVAPGRRVDLEDVEVEVTWPNNAAGFREDQPGPNDPPETVDELQAEGSELDGDFTDQPLPITPVDTLEGMLDASESQSDYENEDAVDENLYVAPSDPVVGINDAGQTEIVGGFASDSMQEIEVERSALDNLPGDEAIADAIRRELREDAATTDLAIHVSVRHGVVRLRGAVPALDDAENAEEVARRVPGVREVEEELEVENL